MKKTNEQINREVSRRKLKSKLEQQTQSLTGSYFFWEGLEEFYPFAWDVFKSCAVFDSLIQFDFSETFYKDINHDILDFLRKQEFEFSITDGGMTITFCEIFSESCYRQDDYFYWNKTKDGETELYRFESLNVLLKELIEKSFSMLDYERYNHYEALRQKRITNRCGM